MVVLIMIGAACWVIADRDRTVNAVALITASRGHPADSDPNVAMEQSIRRV